MPRLQSVERHALGLLAELCSTPTPGGSEALLAPALHREGERLGAAFRLLPVGPGRANVLLSWGKPRVLFTTHLDTVAPELPLRADAEGVAARGAVDAKGQIVAQLGAIELLLEAGYSDIAWLGVAGEEGDSAGAAAAVAAAAAEPPAGGSLAELRGTCLAIVNGEPTGCALASGQRAYYSARLRCVGKAAHGSMPELGKNAIASLMAWIRAVEACEAAQDEVFGAENWNLGRIGGGRAVNVVADEAWAELSLRSVPGGRLRRALEEARPEGGSIETVVDEPWDRFDLIPGLPRAAVPFGSDLPALRALAPRAAAILAGPGSPALAHAAYERMSLAELGAGIELNRSIALHFLAGGAAARAIVAAASAGGRA